MNTKGPIIVIEDDADDQEMLAEIFKKLNYENEIRFFFDGFKALDYITTSGVKPFLILSDINMPVLTGFELRDKIQNNEELRLKCIPYLFLTTAASQSAVVEAYSNLFRAFLLNQTLLLM